MTTDLSNLTEELKKKRMENVALAIRKYQNYKSSIAVTKLDNSLTESTRKNYLTFGLAYIKTGKKHKVVPSSLYDALDKVLNECVQPLTPSKEDKKREYKRDYSKKDVAPPVARLDIVKKPLTARVSYGVRIEDSVKCIDSYDRAVGFLEGLRYMGNKNAKMVSFEALEDMEV